jgi:hypothetical protein
MATLDLDILEQIAIIRQTLAPLRLSRWQMFKFMVAHVYRQSHPVTIVLFFSVILLLVFFILRAFTGEKGIENLGIPIVGGSKQHKLDFKQLVEEGKRLVSYSKKIISL